MSTPLSLFAASAVCAGALVFSFAPRISYAATPTTAPNAANTPAAKTRTPQQQRMVDCNHQAKADGIKGTERRAFMSTCLKGSKTAAAGSAAQHKVKAKGMPATGAKG